MLVNVSISVQSGVTTRIATRQMARDCVCIGPISGTAPAYPPSPVAMAVSHRPRSDQHFITVRDGELKNAQRALKSWAKDVTGLHGILSQTMPLLGCLLVGCEDFKLLDFYSLHNRG